MIQLVFSWNVLADFAVVTPFPRFRRQLSEPCHSFPSPAPAPMGRDGRPLYHRQMSEPSIPFQSQGFKQEYSDPLFEHPLMVGAPLPQSYPPTMMIKQEPRDFTYDSGALHKHKRAHIILLYVQGGDFFFVFLSHSHRLVSVTF